VNKITIRRENGHDTFTDLYRTSGLEIDEDWVTACHPVFSVAAREGDRLLGSATLCRRFGRLVLDYVAVIPEARGLGLGKTLTESCMEFAHSEGADMIWLAARTPGFFRALGAEESEDNILLEECLGCPDYSRGCEPKAMVLKI